MKKRILSFLTAVLFLLTVSACSAAASTRIHVISREDGSGTRGAFVELFGIEEKDADGNKLDKTLDMAEITNSTSVMMTSVASNKNAIGYISLGSLNDTVKALAIDGVNPSVESIKDDSYPISRPFNIATKGDLNPVTQDFLDFILSAEGQDIVESENYIRLEDTGAFNGNKPSGKIVVAGSSSVTPVMEALKEAYLKINTGAEIEIQQSDSTTGMNSVIEGICDIGMASREVKDSELAEGLIVTPIALDGIVVILNHNNALEGLTRDQVKGIYTGGITDWTQVQ